MSYRRYIVNHTRQTATLLFKSLAGECWPYNDILFEEFLKDSYYNDNIELLAWDEFPPKEYFMSEPKPSQPSPPYPEQP